MSNWSGEVEPASIEQVRQGRDGKMVTITEDVADIAKRLKEIDKRLYLRYSEPGSYFVVYCREPYEPEGTGYMVATYQELDPRIIEDIRRVVWENQQPGYSYADEIDKKHDLADAARDYEFSQKIQASAEELAFAIRKDLGNTNKIVVSKDIS
jgi:hypothetical protein